MTTNHHNPTTTDDLGAWDAHRARLGYSDREDPPVLCAAGLIDPNVLTLRLALRQILAEIHRPTTNFANALAVRSARLDAVGEIAQQALDATAAEALAATDYREHR